MTDPCPALILARIRRTVAAARRTGVMIHPDDIEAVLDSRRA